MSRFLCLAALASLAACEPTPELFTNAEAVAFCDERALAASGPRGAAEIGFGSDGPIANFGIVIDADYLAGRSPQYVYTDCLDRLRRNGQIVDEPIGM